jgi:hypothetical protein
LGFNLNKASLNFLTQVPNSKIQAPNNYQNINDPKFYPPHPIPLPPGERGHFGYLVIGWLKFIWDLEFGAWNFNT